MQETRRLHKDEQSLGRAFLDEKMQLHLLLRTCVWGRVHSFRSIRGRASERENRKMKPDEREGLIP